jgi:hypothetical protein
MEKTLLIRGLAMFSTLIGIQQWLARDVSFTDFLFLLLVTAFLLTVENDYKKSKNEASERAEGLRDGERTSGESSLASKSQCSAPILAAPACFLLNWSPYITFH